MRSVLVTAFILASTVLASAAGKQELANLDAAELMHLDCINTKMREVVPYTDQSAKELAMDILDICANLEDARIDAIQKYYKVTKREATDAFRKQMLIKRQDIIEQIVVFRSEWHKVQKAYPQETPQAPVKRETAI